MGGKPTTTVPGATPAATPATSPSAQQNRFGISPEGYQTLGRAVTAASNQFGQAMTRPTPAATPTMNPMAQTPGLTMQFPGGMGRPQGGMRGPAGRPAMNMARRPMPSNNALAGLAASAIMPLQTLRR